MQTTPLREQHLFGRSRRLPADRDQTMTRDIPGFSGTTGMPIRTGAQPPGGDRATELDCAGGPIRGPPFA